MKVKHLKTKTTIELEPNEVDKYAGYLRELDSATSSLNEFGDLYVSDLQNLKDLEWRLADLLGLKFNRETYRYIRKN